MSGINKGRAAGLVAIITGSTRGVGKGIAVQMASEGAKVVITGRSKENGDKVVAEIEALGGAASFFQLNITEEKDFIGAVEFAVDRYGKLTTMINNAAGTDSSVAVKDGPLTEITLDSWNELLKLNLTSYFLGSKYAVKQMIKQGEGGTVVQVSSLAGISSQAGFDAYAAAKGGINAMTRVMANTYSRFKIRTNAIGLGFVPTENPEHQQVAALPSIKDAFFTRLGTPIDVGHLCMFLATEESAFLTGAVIPFDGGASLNIKIPDTQLALHSERAVGN